MKGILALVGALAIATGAYLATAVFNLTPILDYIARGGLVVFVEALVLIIVVTQKDTIKHVMTLRADRQHARIVKREGLGPYLAAVARARGEAAYRPPRGEQ